MSLKDCFSKIKVGDQLVLSWREETRPAHLRFGIFRVEVVGFYSTSVPIIATNDYGFLSGDRYSYTHIVNLPAIENFSSFGLVTISSFNITRII